jgi:1-acyl-sn-glycerol-3-phosphate acyltransferase
MSRQIFIAVSGAAIAFAASAVWRARRCSAGWRVWLCYQIVEIHRFLFTRCTATNQCTYPEQGPAIIVANHTSPVDPMLLWTRHFAQFNKPRLRVIGFMMAKEYYDSSRIIRWVSNVMESIPVERSGRDMAPIREALRRLQNGHLLGLFPEGRLNVTSPTEQLLPGETGVAWLALRSGAPVIPVFICNAPRCNSMVGMFFKPTRATLTYGPPIDLSKWKSNKPSHADLVEVTDLIMDTLAEMGGLRTSPTSV